MTQVQILPPAAKFLKKTKDNFYEELNVICALYNSTYLYHKIIPWKLISTSRGLFYWQNLFLRSLPVNNLRIFTVFFVISVIFALRN